MAKYNFCIIGSGWRALFYIRIAKALQNLFNVQAVYCRTQEKAHSFSKTHNVFATNKIEEINQLKPDFIVVAVKKTEEFNVASQWLNQGYTVLAETPAAMNQETIQKLNDLVTDAESKGESPKLVVAEQYIFYPEYSAILKLLQKGILGDINYISISLTNDYHAASLIRNFLGTNALPLKTTAQKFSFPTTETLTRYENFTDGRIKDKTRTIALFEFPNNKAALYDFDSEQYRSPIRNHFLKIQGVKGELYNQTVHYLNEKNKAVHAQIKIETITHETQETNPNLHFVEEVAKITFEGEPLYEAPFGICGLAQDETAIARLLLSTAQFAKGEQTAPIYPLKEAIKDSIMALNMEQNSPTN